MLWARLVVSLASRIEPTRIQLVTFVHALPNPLIDVRIHAQGMVVGQLSGACGFNPNDSCDATNNATVDGAFAAYYDEVAQFLDPVPVQCTVDEPQEVSCTDGFDNDCDGAIDSADPDCESATGGGLNDPCRENVDCMSGLTCSRGKPSTRVCQG